MSEVPHGERDGERDGAAEQVASERAARCFAMLRDHSGLVQVLGQDAAANRLAVLPVESAVSIVGKELSLKQASSI